MICLVLLIGMMTTAYAQFDESNLIKYSDRGDVERVYTILESGVEPDTWDRWGRTPLLLAIEGGHKVVVELLLAAGADFDIPDDEGNTPLMQAIFHGHFGIAFDLIERGANVYASNNGGDSAFYLAYCGGHFDIAELLSSITGQVTDCPSDVPEESPTANGDKGESEDEGGSIWRGFYVGSPPFGPSVIAPGESHYSNQSENIESDLKHGVGGEFQMGPFGYARGPWRFDINAAYGYGGEVAIADHSLSSVEIDKIHDRVDSGPHFFRFSLNAYRDFWRQAPVSPFLGVGWGVKNYQDLSLNERALNLFESASSPSYFQFFAGANIELESPTTFEKNSGRRVEKPGYRMRVEFSYMKENELSVGNKTLQFGGRVRGFVGLETFWKSF